jgi:glycosyl hydrolase family 10
MNTPNRRQFLSGAAAAGAGALGAAVDATASGAGNAAASAAQSSPDKQGFSAAKKMVGIQVGAVSFVDEGVEPVLDNFQKLAAVNTLFVATFTYGRGIAGRQVPGQPMPDHGKQEHDLDYHGGNYAKIHPQYYRKTALKDFRAPDHGDYDVLEAVLPQARKRGMKVICWYEDVFRKDVPAIEKLQEKDLYGRNTTTLCFNNPDYRNWLTALTEDYVRSYDIDGVMWGSERQGAFSNALGASHGGAGRDPGLVTCFCEFCQRKAKERGISVERAKAGFQTLEKFVRDGRGGKRPVDGYYVTLWRLMLRYPELLAWEMLWTDSLRETYQAIYRQAKAAKPQVGVGWHIWHNNSFNPIYRAEQDLAEIAPYSDFLKIVIYHNCGGERMASYIGSVSQTLYGDVPKQELLDFHYRVMDYKEKSLAEIPGSGWSADYVHRETARARAGLAGAKTLLWPGIDIDIPTAAASSKSTPEGTKQAVLAAFRAGADGVLLSRKYSEMKLANLRGAGDAIRELRLA